MPEAGHIRILLAEDEPVVREALESMLDVLGYAWTSARDGQEALERLDAASDPFQVAILDVNMPRMGGAAAVAHIWQRYPGMPAILTSGFPERELLGALAKEGPVHFLQKPFTLAELQSALQLVATAK